MTCFFAIFALLPWAGPEPTISQRSACSVLVSCNCCNITSSHELGGLKHHKFILSHFWRPEIQNQGVSRSGSLQRLWGKESSFQELPALLAFFRLWLNLSGLCLHLLLLLCVSHVSQPLCYQEAFRVQLDNPRLSPHPRTLPLITSAET